jgi:hypothetical protein
MDTTSRIIAEEDLLEAPATVEPRQYAQFGRDLDELRRKLDLPASTTNTEVILEAVHFAAAAGPPRSRSRL